jgi:hypothetical protein
LAKDGQWWGIVDCPIGSVASAEIQLDLAAGGVVFSITAVVRRLS